MARAAAPSFGLPLFAAGFVTFSLLYETQPILPLLASAFGVGPAGASLTVSAATFSLAAGMLAAAPLADTWGRVPVLKAGVVLASLLGLLVPLALSFPILVGLRALQGLALSGVPAVAMAYLSEEAEPGRIGASMGLFISGNAVGGMVGRLTVGLLSGRVGWHGALLVLAAADLALALYFVRAVPPSRRFRPRPPDRAAIARGVRASLGDPTLLGLHAFAFLAMGSFVTVYNYLAFALEGPPWRLEPAQVSWVFLMYVVGMVASPAAGRLSDLAGRPRVLLAGLLVQLGGAAVTLATPLPVKLLGLGLFTSGFFSAHSVASSWVGQRGGSERAAASAHYLLAYYAGSSSVGTLGGLVMARAGWAGVVALVAALLAVAAVSSLALGRGPGARPPRAA